MIVKIGKMKSAMFLALCAIFGLSMPNVHAQMPFSVEINEFSFPSFPGIHSGAWAQRQGKWIFIGGRTNGLHGFLPPLAFPSSGIPREIWAVDPQTGQMQTATLNNLPLTIFESVSASNLEFYQDGATLYLIGGYGWCDTANAFRTFPTLTALNLDQVLDSLDSGGEVSPAFRQITDQRMAITGGHLERLGQVYQLVFGHRFDGIYDRVDSTGFFVQDYSYQIRRFNLFDDGDSLAIDNYATITDSTQFRRRDYNLVPQVIGGGEIGLTAFSGVFRPEKDQPWYHTIRIDSGGYVIDAAVNQRYAHYHSAVMPIYDGASDVMHTVFFGGMAEDFRDTLTGQIRSDTLVPFVRSISMMSRDALGIWTETLLPIKMPAYLGTNMYFLPHVNAHKIHDKIIVLDSIPIRAFVGFLIGGIESPEPNIADTDPSLSFASQRIFEVYIDRQPNAVQTEKALPWFSAGPNPIGEKLEIEGGMPAGMDFDFQLMDIQGRIVQQWQKTGTGSNETMRVSIPDLQSGIYLLQISNQFGNQVIRLVKN